jgi:mono/diheme cytochrome c family protein
MSAAERGRRVAGGLLAGLGLAAAALAASSCNPAGPRQGYELLPDMAHSVPYDTFQPNPVTRNGQTLQPPVPGTVARGKLPLRYAATPADALRAGRELRDPFAADAAVLQRGKAVYETFCRVCHGERGQGDGPLIPKFPNPPAYTSPRVREMAAGQIFHTISLGTSLMPSYAAQISPDDRWRAVRYVQRLAAAPAPAAAPGPTSPPAPAAAAARPTPASAPAAGAGPARSALRSAAPSPAARPR